MRRLITRGRTLVLSSTARSAYILFAGNLTDSVFAFLFTIITFRLLTTADFGIFSALNNFVFTAVLILDLGLGSALLHFLPYWNSRRQPSRSEAYLSAAFLMRVGIASAVGLMLGFFSFVIAPGFFKTDQNWAIILAGASLVTISGLDILNFALQAYRKFLPSAIAANTFSLLRFIFVCAFALLGLPFSVTTATAITLISPVLGIILPVRWLPLPRLYLPAKPLISSLLGFSGWLGVAKITSTVATRLDIQIVLLFLGTAAAGIYSVAARLANFYPVIIASFTAVLATRLSSMTTPGQLLRFSPKVVLFQLILASGMLLAIGLARPFVTLLFGLSAAPSVPLFRGLTLAYLPYLLASFPNAVIIYYFKRPNVAGFMGLIQLATAFFSNLVATPIFQSFGPIISLGLANTLLLLINLFMVAKLWTSASSAPALPD